MRNINKFQNEKEKKSYKFNPHRLISCKEFSNVYNREYSYKMVKLINFIFFLSLFLHFKYSCRCKLKTL